MLAKRAAIDVLRAVVGPPAGLADLVDRDDIGVMQTGGGRGLGAEPQHAFRVVVRTSDEHLQSDEAFQFPVAGLVHNSHTAAAQAFQDVETFDGRDVRCNGSQAAAARRERLDTAGWTARFEPEPVGFFLREPRQLFLTARANGDVRHHSVEALGRQLLREDLLQNVVCWAGGHDSSGGPRIWSISSLSIFCTLLRAT